MLELKICIFRNNEGNLESWLDLLGLYASCEDFERFVLEQFVGITTGYTFSIRSQDLKPEHQPLFFALAKIYREEYHPTP